MRYLLALLILAALAGCGGPPARDRLNGTWDSPLGAYTFDTAASTMTRELSTGPQTKAYTVQSERENAVVFVTDGAPITATFQDDGTMLLMQDGKLPLVLTRRE